MAAIIKQNKILLITICSIYILFGVVSLTKENPHFDEINSHLPTLKLFVEHNPITALQSPDYKSASTPLPYIITSIPYKIINSTPDIFSAKLINLLISLLTMFIFIRLCDVKTKNILYPALILFFYPYFIKPSFLFFMSIYGLLFFLLFIYFIKKHNRTGYFLGGLSISLAILSQQFYLVVFLFYLGFLLYDSKNYKLNKGKLSDILLFILPFILPVMVFIFWGGLTHPSYRYWGAEFHIQNLTSVFIVLGSAMLPFLIFSIAGIRKSHMAILLSLSVLLVLFASPEWVSEPMVGGISGYTFHSLAFIGNFSSISSFILKVILCLLGLFSLIILYNKSGNDKNRLLYFLFITIAIGFTFNKLPSERHLLPLVSIAYLISFSFIKKEVIYRVWLVFQVIIGSIYFYYIMFVYSSGL